MKNIFNKYAAYYDTLYKDKNYVKECQFLEKIFSLHAHKPVRDILDLGCGTGNHALILGKKHYHTIGVDQSDAMIRQAQQRAIREKIKNVQFLKGDLRTINLKQEFDVVTALFDVFSYQTTEKDILDTCITAHNHLKKNGLFIFDFWYGPAVLSQKPQPRIKIIPQNNQKIIRFACPTLHILEQTVTVDYTIIKIQKNKSLEEIYEKHVMRFFFPQELNTYLTRSKFLIKQFTPFMELARPPTENDWKAMVVAKKI